MKGSLRRNDTGLGAVSDEEKKGKADATEYDVPSYPTDDTSSMAKSDLLSRENIDPALANKMYLVNNAIDEIGFTMYHWKLFCLNGFG